MAGGICSVFNCYNYSVSKCSKSYFRFPRDRERCQEWVQKCHRADLDRIFKKSGPEHMNKNYRICSDHFSTTCFRNSNLPSQGLIKGSVPSQNVFKQIPQEPCRANPKKRLRDEDLSQKEDDLSRNFTDAPVPLLDARLPKRFRIDPEKKIKLLRTKLLQQQKSASRLRQRIRKLQGDVSTLVKKCKNLERKSILVNTASVSPFILSQLHLQQKRLMARRYTESERTFALAIYYCSTNCYKFLQKHFCLPSIRSLRRWLQNLSVTPGINDGILNMMKLKSQLLPIDERVVSVAFDEMSLKTYVHYDAQADLFEGFPDLGNGRLRYEEKRISDDGTKNLANQVLVVMIRGIRRNFKQVVGYFLAKDAIDGKTLQNIIFDVLRKIRASGFIPKVLVCDQGPNNLKMHRLLEISDQKPFVELDGELVYVFFDAPHLLKSVRNNFKKYDIKVNGETISWDYVCQFYQKDKDMNPRLAPNLKQKHIVLPPFSPMRVCLAAQVLSHSVSRGILTLVSLNSMTSLASPTAIFLEKLDNIFDVFNSSQLNSPKIFRTAIKESSPHWKFLEGMTKYLRNLVFLNQNKAIPPCIKGWLLNISALKQLWNDLKEHYNFQFLFTRRLTQDCVENLFSVLRSKGGNNVTPDCSKFRYTIRATICNQLLSPSPDGNCEIDLAKYLLKKEDFLKSTGSIQLVETVRPDLPSSSTINENIDCLDEKLDLAQDNSRQYVAGWVCSRLLHADCRKQIASYDESYNLEDIHISMKKYDNAKLLYPNKDAQMLSTIICGTFNNCFIDFLNTSCYKVKAKMISLVDKPVDLKLCEECFNIYVNTYFNVMINCFVKRTNDLCARSLKKKENKKAKKIMHI